MRQLLPAVVVLLVVVVLTTGAVGPSAADATSATTTTPVVPLQNTTSYLALEDGGDTSRHGNATLDVAGAAAMDVQQLDAAYVETTTVEAFRAAGNETERTRALERGLSRLENRTAALEQRHQRTIQQYNDGDLTTEQFLREMAVIDARARAVNAAAQGIYEQTILGTEYTPPPELRTRLGRPGQSGNVQMVPDVVTSPIRESVGESIAGETTDTTVYVETTADGVVMSRIAGGQYVREAYRADRHEPGGSGQFDIDGVYERARTLYPWAAENRITSPSADGYGNTAVYRITIDHTQGRLVTFMDATTTDAFREVQEKRLSTLPATLGGLETTDDGMEIRVNTTHETGPMEINVYDVDEGGEPLDARITVDGQYVGETGPTGRLWAVQPSGRPVVNATTDDGRTVETTVFSD